MSQVKNLRPDLQYIADWIPPQSRVLDLGCGDGELLAWLAAQKQVSGYGVEIDVNGVVGCVANGVNVIQSDMESGLSTFEDHSFDYVVLSLTIQAMHNIEGILQEMVRVGKTGIVTFPNFGFWENRWQILMGRMPVSETIPFEWYNTPNIHFCTVHDFAKLLNKSGLKIDHQLVLNQGEKVEFLPNLLGSLALVRFNKV
ncbi:methionine biosynthesis protein MetW [Iodobacter fluviatilis]|uniref:Methionine biosynthesis protein MetW n=1 Tax=Iodobacter fluviatilis TaxID=537 RepID=A0A377SWP3_9NEIS|nr:methionine biosynthesis protein MetW [Iodobacter fluviatilis]TCU81664.1 methionine biosynthesis protein MetW [Iodobacter fluviatilis]STR44736.1 methionine biosynthesis protein MetW [Iodobacter fluviatilis]